MLDSLRDHIKQHYSISSEKIQYPIFIGAGESGEEIVNKLLNKIGSQNDKIEHYRMDVGNKGHEFQELIFNDFNGKSILICDSIVNTGSTLLQMRKYFLEKGAKDVKTLTIFLRNGSKFIPNFWVSAIENYEDVIFGIKKYPINCYPKGSIKKIEQSDCGQKINCGKQFIRQTIDDYYHRQCMDPECCGFLIEDEGKNVGILFLKYLSPSIVYLEAIGIDEDKQDLGYGSTLMSFFEDFCRMNRIKKVKIWAYEDRVGFYEKFEFQKTGRISVLPSYGVFVEMEIKYLFNV
jgi:hypoxanthine phosphoribosyltransferase